MEFKINSNFIPAGDQPQAIKKLVEGLEKKEKYLGTKLPKNINKIKEEFLREFYQETWFNRFDALKEQYTKERKNIPPSLEKKQTEQEIGFSEKFVNYPLYSYPASFAQQRASKNICLLLQFLQLTN